MSGSVSSASAIALEEPARAKRFSTWSASPAPMTSPARTASATASARRQNAYMAAKALAPVVAKALGKNIKTAFLVPDYTYGHTVSTASPNFPRSKAGSRDGKEVVPLGKHQYSSALLNIANSGADVFVNIAFGADAVASTKQAEQFGVLKRMKLVVPNLSSFQDKELGAEIMRAFLAAAISGGACRIATGSPRPSSRRSLRRTSIIRAGAPMSATCKATFGRCRSNVPAHSIRSR